MLPRIQTEAVTLIEVLSGDATRGGKVRVSAEGLALFNSRWPCSELRGPSDRHPTRAYWFEFDSRGDLVDCDVPADQDGSAAVAMADDCKAYLFEGQAPEWA